MEEEKNRAGSVNNNINSNLNNTKNIDNSLDKKTSDNNQVNDINSFSTTSSPIKETVSNIGEALGDKYKSRRRPTSIVGDNTNRDSNHDVNSNKNSEINVNSNNKILPNTRELSKKVINANKSIKSNIAKNAVSNLHPALKAINTVNNVKNAIARRADAAIPSSDSSVNSDDADDNTATLSNNVPSSPSVLDGADSEEEDNSGSLGSLFGSKTSASGRFSFFGRLPTAVKIGIALIGPLLPLIIFILVPIVVIGYFSSFWGLDRVLASSGISSGSGGSGSISYGDYTLSSSGDQILHTSIESFLASNGSSLEEFNNLITSNVNDAGFGTRAGVVAAAVTLIGELGDNYNVKVPYFWGGGHGRVADGVVANWGSNECHTYANGTSYNYCGLDCSGFVSWAIYNGGYNMYPMSSGSFSNLAGAKRVSLKNSAVLQPGDLLDSNGHVILVVDIDEESKEYICAEASGNTTGVLFSRHPFNLSGYWGVDLEGFYNTEARS